MSRIEPVTVEEADAGIRLDRWFARHYPELGHGALAKLLRTGQVRLDGRRAKAGDRVAAGQAVRVPPLDTPAPRTAAAHPTLDRREVEEVRSWILYEDPSLVVLDKPPGLPTQGGPGIGRHLDGLLDALRLPGSGERPRLVHRLDKDTSGVILIARTARAAAALAAAFKGRDAGKLYWALVRGVPSRREGKIVAAVEKVAGKGGERVAVTEAGKPARTLWRVIDHAGTKAAWLALEPLSGRTHQLRVHCLHIGHPIVGDGKYAGAEAHLGGLVSRKLHLHARRLRLPHPDGGMLDVTAPLPRHMADTWASFGWDADMQAAGSLFSGGGIQSGKGPFSASTAPAR